MYAATPSGEAVSDATPTRLTVDFKYKSPKDDTNDFIPYVSWKDMSVACVTTIDSDSGSYVTEAKNLWLNQGTNFND